MAEDLARPTVFREGLAGVVAAVGTMPQTISWGLLIFLPLGAAYAGRAVATAILTSALATFVTAARGQNPIFLPGPRPISSLMLVSMVAWMAAQPQLALPSDVRAGAVVLLTGLAVGLSGLAQIALAKLRLAGVVNYVPQPVTVGFNLGVAVVLVLTYLPVALGLGVAGRANLLHPGTWDFREGAAAATTLVVYLVWLRRGPPSVPPLLAGIVAGALVVLALGARQDFAQIQLAVPALPLIPVSGGAVEAAFAFLLSEHGAVYALFVASLTLVASAEALLNMGQADALVGMFSDPGRQLVVEGQMKLVAGASLGVMASSGLPRAVTLFRSGGRTRLATVFVGAGLLVIALFLVDASRLLPPALIGGIMLTLAHSLVDPWGVKALARLVPLRAAAPASVAPLGAREGLIVLATAAAGVLIHPLAAVATGVAVSIAIFVHDMSRPVVASDVAATALRSRRMRPAGERARLARLMEQVRVLSLEGSLFFGTSDGLRRHAERLLAQTPGVAILRLGGLVALDATGAMVLQQSFDRLRRAGWRLAATEAPPKLPRTREMADAFGARWFDRLDEALEWAETLVLEQDGRPASAAALTPAAALDPLLRGLPDPLQAALTKAFSQRSVAAGEAIFRAGDVGDALYVARTGLVRIELGADAQALRVATFAPGVVFGEMALIDSQPRSATARAEGPCDLLALTHWSLAAAEIEAPGATAGLMRNLARIMAGRLRDTNRYLLDAAN